MNLTNTCKEHYMDIPREEGQPYLLAEEQIFFKKSTPIEM